METKKNVLIFLLKFLKKFPKFVTNLKFERKTEKLIINKVTTKKSSI